MYPGGWMIAPMVLSTIAAVVVWTILVGLLVAWIRDHHNHHHRHAR